MTWAVVKQENNKFMAEYEERSDAEAAAKYIGDCTVELVTYIVIEKCSCCGAITAKTPAYAYREDAVHVMERLNKTAKDTKHCYEIRRVY